MALFIWSGNSWEQVPDTDGLNKNAFVKDNSEGVLFFMKDSWRVYTYTVTYSQGMYDAAS